jgi:hypothetical protein
LKNIKDKNKKYIQRRESMRIGIACLLVSALVIGAVYVIATSFSEQEHKHQGTLFFVQSTVSALA